MVPINGIENPGDRCARELAYHKRLSLDTIQTMTVSIDPGFWQG